MEIGRGGEVYGKLVARRNVSVEEEEVGRQREEGGTRLKPSRRGRITSAGRPKVERGGETAGLFFHVASE